MIMLSTSFLQHVKLFFKVFIILIMSVGLSACFFSQNSAPTSDLGHRPVSSKKTNTQHIVKRGETLYSIAWRYGLDYKQLARSNNIGNDFLIRVGQVLKLSTRRTTAPTKKNKVTSASVAAKSVSTIKNTSRRVNVSRKEKLSTAYPKEITTFRKEIIVPSKISYK